MKASAKKTQINHKRSNVVKGNVTYVSSFKKRNNVKPYIKFDLDWQNIIRANDPGKRLHEASVNLASRTAYELHKNHDRKVYLSTHWMQDVTKKGAKQTARIRTQIGHIFNMIWRPKIFDNGVWLHNVFEVSYQEGYEEILGLEDVVKTACTQENIEPVPTPKNVLGVGHKSLDYIDNKGLEEEAKAYSSSNPHNEKLKIKSFSEAEATPQETIIEVPTLAISSLAELAKVYQTEEIRSEATEVVTIYDHLAVLRAIQDVPILANVANIPNEEGGVITEQISTITQLTSEIFRAFDSKTSEKIMENCIFEELEPKKLGISIHAEFTISDHDKQKLKSCIRMAYGSDVQMVNTSVVKQKPTTSSESVRENRTIGEVASIKEHITSYPTQSSYKNEWDLMKVKIAEHFSENKYNHVMSVWLEKLNFARVEGDKIIVTGSCFYVDEVFNRFATAIDNAVVKTKKSLVLQYEGNAQRPIEFSYKQILSRR